MARLTSFSLEQPDSTPASSASDFLDGKQLNRRLFRIQRKQQELLDKADSWAQYLIRQPKPGVNLPPEILENLRAFHKRQTSLSNRQNSSVEVAGTPRAADADEPAASQSPTPADAQFLSQAEAGEENGVSIPWSPSPVAEVGSVGSMEELDQLHPSRSSSPPPNRPEAYNAIEQQVFESQVPARSPLHPTSDTANAQRRPVFNDFPSSSLSADEELEMVAPAPFTAGSLSSGSRNAELDPTPPSAQVQVPCTFDGTAPSVQTPIKAVKPRPYKELASIHKVQERVDARSRATKARLSPSSRGKINEFEVPEPPSSLDSASSVIPATHVMKPRISPVKTHRMQPMRSTIKETPRIRNRSVAHLTEPISTPQSDQQPYVTDPAVSNDIVRNKATSPRSSSPQVSLPSSKPDEGQGISNIVSGAISSPLHDTPFLRYSLAYPSYKGSIGDFVTACMCIPRRRLATYQYDDFIRSWSEGYLPYVAMTDSALTAIDWYMETSEELPISYQSMIVTKANLETTLELHAEEVNTILKASKAKQVTRSSLAAAAELDDQNQHLPTLHSIENEQDMVSVLPKVAFTMVEDMSEQAEQAEAQHATDQPSTTHEQELLHGQPELAEQVPKQSLKRRPGSSLEETSSKRGSCDITHPSSEASAASKRYKPSRSTVWQPPVGSPASTGPSGRCKDPKEFGKFVKTWKRKRPVKDDISITSCAPTRALPATASTKQQK